MLRTSFESPSSVKEPKPGTALDSDAVLDIVLRGATGRGPEILWAKQVKPITFELSGYERAAADSVSEPSSNRRGSRGEEETGCTH